MFDDRSQLVGFLNKLAIFQKLTTAQLDALLDQFKRVRLKQGEKLIAQGEPGDSMYIVLSGRIRISRGKREQERELGNLVSGDIFGEESLLYHQLRSATATAIEPSELLSLGQAEFAAVLKKYPQLKSYLVAIVNSRRLIRQQRHPWLGQGETIYLMARKHIAFLLISLVKPLVLSWFSVPFFLIAAWAGESGQFSMLINAVGVGVLLLAILWAIWIWIDWGNDFYIVTDQRVVWIEKVIGLYDSRQEAPLSTVLTVGTKMDAIGRELGYGDVIVRTYTGQIVMASVGLPEQLASYILELQNRARFQVKQAETAALEQEIRKRLGLTPPQPPKKEPAPQEPQKTPPARQRKPRPAPGPNYFAQIFQNFFKVRYEQKGVVTYRKHWILLVEAVWKQSLIILAILILDLLRIFEVYQFLSVPVTVLVSAFLIFIIMVWWIYDYLDWRNDIYQLSSDQIIDVYKKPLGTEDKKTANLENILSLQHQRKGILGLLFNYGDVTAMVGGTKFVFEGVYDPAGVEQDIFERINARKRQQKEAADTQERERVAEWMAAYHRQMEALRRGENNTKTDLNSG